MEDMLVHRLVDQAGVFDLVGPDAFQTGGFDGLLDHLVRRIEIQHPPGLKIGLRNIS